MNPLIVVRLLTYNHESYIKQCLDSVLSQIVNFNYQVIIGEDCSTDRTAVICREFEKQYPEIIKLYSNDENNLYLNSLKNWEYCAQSKAKYISLLEGDDYWTDPYKLQKQVDFLEANPEYSMCFHPVEILNEKTGEIEEISNQDLKDIFNINDLAKGNFIHTPSVVFRNGLFDFNHKLLRKVPAADYLIHMLNARKGLIKKLDEPMAVYRKHENGIWSANSQKKIHEKWVYQMDLMIPVFNDFKEVRTELLNQKKKYIKILRKQNKALQFVRHIIDFITYRFYKQWFK